MTLTDRVTRWLAGIAAVALIAPLVVFVLWSQREPISPDAKRSRAAAGAPDGEASNDALPSPAHASPIEPARDRGAANDARRELESPPGPEPAVMASTVGVDVHVIAVDAAGVEHPSEDGWATATGIVPMVKGVPLYEMETGSTGPTQVVDGRFRAEIKAGAKLGVKEIKLGGKPAIADSTEYAVVVGEVVTVRAFWVEAVTLRVLDDATGAELGDVTVVEMPEGWGRTADVIHPGRIERRLIVFEHAASPLALPPPDSIGPHGSRDRHRDYWVVAPGHAWGQLGVDFHVLQTEFVVRLGPGATLILDVSGELPQPDPQLRLRAPAVPFDFEGRVAEMLANFEQLPASGFPGGRKPTRAEFETMIAKAREEFTPRSELGPLRAEREAQLGETRLEGLPPGELVATVELGENWGSSLVAGKVAVTLAAGDEQRVALPLAPQAPPVAPVELAGTLYAPASWQPDELELKVTPMTLRGATGDDTRRVPVRDMQPLADRPGWVHWSAGALRPARYRVEVEKAAFSTTVDVAPPACPELAIVLPESTQLTVRFLDDATGEEVKLEQSWGVTWQPFDQGGVLDVFGGVSLEGRGAVKRARVPVGRGAIVVNHFDWRLAGDTSHEVSPGEQTLEVRLRRATSLRLTLQCEGEPASLDDMSRAVELEPVGHTGMVTMWSSSSGGELQYGVTDPGRWRIRCLGVAGYAPFEPIELDLPDGQATEHVIELKRAK